MGGVEDPPSAVLDQRGKCRGSQDWGTISRVSGSNSNSYSSNIEDQEDREGLRYQDDKFRAVFLEVEREKEDKGAFSGTRGRWGVF